MLNVLMVTSVRVQFHGRVCGDRASQHDLAITVDTSLGQGHYWKGNVIAEPTQNTLGGWVREDKDPHILDFGTWWKWVAIFRVWLLCLRNSSPDSVLWKIFLVHGAMWIRLMFDVSPLVVLSALANIGFPVIKVV